MGLFDKFKKTASNDVETVSNEQYQQAVEIYNMRLDEAKKRVIAEMKKENSMEMDFSFINEYSAFLQFPEFDDLQDVLICVMVYKTFLRMVVERSVFAAYGLTKAILTIPKTKMIEIAENISDLSVFDRFDEFFETPAIDPEADIYEQILYLDNNCEAIEKDGMALKERLSECFAIQDELKKNKDPQKAIYWLENFLLSDWTDDMLLNAKRYLICLAIYDEDVIVNYDLLLSDGSFSSHGFDMYFEAPYLFYFSEAMDENMHYPSVDLLIAEAVYVGEREGIDYDLNKNFDRFLKLLEDDEYFDYSKSVLALQKVYDYYDLEEVLDKLEKYTEEC